MSGPLDGIRVLDLTSVVLGPYATQIMGDLGADVIKVESPEGDTTRNTGEARHPGMATVYLNANRNKRSLVLDLKQESARDALMRLVEGADVFVHSIRPQKIAALGFGPEPVQARNPRIIYAAIHGFREDGPYSGRPAYDDIIQGACGISALMQAVTGEPLYTPMVTADKTCGLTTAYAVMAALFHRERNGQGQAIEIPMYETMVSFTLVENLYGWVFDPPQGQIGYPRAMTSYRRPHKTADGYVCFLAYTDAQWARFWQQVGRPELSRDPRFLTLAERTTHIEPLYELAGQYLAKRTTAEWLEVLARLEIPHMPMNRLEDLPNDPHLKAVGFFRKVDHPTEGPLLTTDIPVRYSRTPGAIERPAPGLGEHSVALLEEAGCEAADIERMIEDGATINGR